MRITYIVTTLGIGGAEKQVVSIAERMAARGHTVSLLVLKHAEEEWPTKLPVLRLNLRKTPMGIWRGLRFAESFLSVVRPQILHSHTFPANIFARMLRILLRAEANPPIIINTIHNVYEGRWHRMMLYRLSGRWADAITAVSTAAAQRFMKVRAVQSEKLTVLTNGIDTDEFISETKIRKQTRSQMQAGIKFVWLAVGRVAPAKDYPNLLRAFASVQQHQPETKLWIAGEGDPTLTLELSHVILAQHSDVEMLGLRLDIRQLLDAADGFVLSSAWEGLPLAVGEAMAMGKPVVATDVGGVQELVGDAGILVAPADSAALAQAMLQIMSMPDKHRIAMGRTAGDRIRASFSLNAKVEEWVDFYTSLLQRREA